MGNTVSCDPCARHDQVEEAKAPIDLTPSSFEASGLQTRKMSRRKLLEAEMNGYSHTRKRPTLRERRQTLRRDSEISESQYAFQNIKLHQEELDKDIEDDSKMQLYNLQNSFKPKMMCDNSFKAMLSKKLSATKKYKASKFDQSMEKSNFMSKISKLQQSATGSSLGGLTDSKLSSRLSTQSKQRLMAINCNNRMAQYAKFYKDIAINKDKVAEDEKWLQEKLKDQEVINESEMSIYGKGLMKVDKSIVHAFLYANIQENITKNEFEMLNDTQTVVNMEQQPKEAKVTEAKKIFENHQQSFSPQNSKAILDFLKKNSRILKNNGTMSHIYDTLNSHVFQVLDSEDADRKQIIIKIPKIQTKRGILDLIFETQLQLYMKKSFQKYMFKIREEIFQMKENRLMNYVVIEERDHCNQFGHQMNLMDFIAQTKQNKSMPNKNQKILYLLYQAVDLAKKLTNDAQVLNYNIHPINLIITENWQLKLIDFSIVDMVHSDGHSLRRNTRDSDSLQQEVQMRSEFKAHIKKTAKKQIPLDEAFSQSSRVIQIKTTQDYFCSIKDIHSVDLFVLKKILGCFGEFITGGTSKKDAEIETNQVYQLIDMLNKQAESSKFIEIISNQIQSFICFDMRPELYQGFTEFILSPESSFNSHARLELARTTLEISTIQNNDKLKAISYLAIGEITKNLEQLQLALKIYEESSEVIFQNNQYGQLCINLAREYRKNKETQSEAIQFLEQAFTINTKENTQSQSSGTLQKYNHSLILEYYQELGLIMVDEKKTTQAIDCFKKALKISISLHGEEHFVTFECILNLAQLLDENGEKEEAEQLFKKCLTSFDKQDSKMVMGQEITDDLDEIGFDESSDLSDKVMKQQAQMKQQQNMNNMEERDATVIQKIAIYFRQKQEYERACDLLERVLEIKKSLKLKDVPENTTESQKMNILQSKEFAALYSDLSLTYSGMGEMEYAQEYLVLAIQCLEKEQENTIELVESYLHLADILRKQADIEQCIQAMLKSIEIEQELPDRQLSLAESYKQLAEDYIVQQDYEQGIQSSQLALEIELDIYEDGVLDTNIQETLLFIAEAYQISQQFVKSNESLSNILEHLNSEAISDQVKLKSLKLVQTNLENLDNFEESIQYQMRTLKYTHDEEEKINIYQEIANNFLQIEDYVQAIDNQLMVYNMLKKMFTLDDNDENEQTIQALYNLVQIKFQVIQQQIQLANETQDPSVIQTEFLIETQENLKLILEKITKQFGPQCSTREDFEQVTYMVEEIEQILS